ncbi:tape measure protein, partial [Roseomonas sp. DSM 102946]|nr:tape measure protein [Roseomonas sp. DSM 102946]
MADATRRVSVRLSLDDAARVKAELREVGETGQRSLDQIKGGAERASRSLDLLDVATRGIQLAGVAVAARALVQAGDALTQSLSRLQNATGSIERASSVYEALYRNALSTGVAVSESVDAFQRFSIAAREIGATSDQVIRLVTGLQRVAIVSGASTGEISSATLQLAQALASGVLQGDELRSILEAMPLLAEGLARELGVSIGELRKLGSEGKLTAERVFPALLRATERLGAELDRAPLSLGRAFGQLTAATENFLGQLDRAIGLSNALARALSAAARAVDGVRQGAGMLSEEERFAGMRRQAEALAAQIARLESENDGRPSLAAQTRRGSIRPGLVGAAEQQAGVDRTARLEELRRQYTELQAEITRGEQAAGERQRTEQESAATAAAEARRRRATQDVQELTRDLDDRFR